MKTSLTILITGINIRVILPTILVSIVCATPMFGQHTVEITDSIYLRILKSKYNEIEEIHDYDRNDPGPFDKFEITDTIVTSNSIETSGIPNVPPLETINTTLDYLKEQKFIDQTTDSLILIVAACRAGESGDTFNEYYAYNGKFYTKFCEESEGLIVPSEKYGNWMDYCEGLEDDPLYVSSDFKFFHHYELMRYIFFKWIMDSIPDLLKNSEIDPFYMAKYYICNFQFCEGKIKSITIITDIKNVKEWRLWPRKNKENDLEKQE